MVGAFNGEKKKGSGVKQWAAKSFGGGVDPRGTPEE